MTKCGADDREKENVATSSVLERKKAFLAKFFSELVVGSSFDSRLLRLIANNMDACFEAALLGIELRHNERFAFELERALSNSTNEVTAVGFRTPLVGVLEVILLPLMGLTVI